MRARGRLARSAPGRRWHPHEVLFLPDGSDARLRRLRYTGPGAVLVAVAHERCVHGGGLPGIARSIRLSLRELPGRRAPCRPGGGARAGGAAGCVGGGRARASEVGGPLSFVYGNCVFATGLDDGWAAFSVPVGSYACLPEDEKRARFLALLGALEAVQADVQIVRVAAAGTPSATCASWASGDGEVARRDGEQRRGSRARDALRQEHAARLRELDAGWPCVFLLVSLRDPERDVATYVSRAAERTHASGSKRCGGASRCAIRRLLSAAELERVRVRADQVHARVADFLEVRPARGVELQWLVRRAFCRGLGEPQVEGLHEPRALVFERNGQALLAPLEGDVLRWSEAGWSTAGARCASSPSRERAGRRSWCWGRSPSRPPFPARAWS